MARNSKFLHKISVLAVAPSIFQSNIEEKFKGYGGIMKPNIHPKFKGDSSGGFIDDSKTFFQNANEMIHSAKLAIQWLNDWKEHTVEFTVKTLGWVYNFLSDFILQTPSWLFSSDWFMKIALIFGAISIFVSILISCMEAAKAISNQAHTDWKRPLRRLPLAVIATAVTPIAFHEVFRVLNKVTSVIVKAGQEQMSIALPTGIAVKTLDAVALLAFDIVLIGALVPITLTIARRWFDLLALGALTPVAFSTWLFKGYDRYHAAWWTTLKRLSLVQLYYAIFITIIGVMIMGVHSTTSVNGLLAHLLVIAGGLWRMAAPPLIVKRHMDNGAQIETMYRQTADVITGKQMRKTIKSLQLTTDPKAKKPISKFIKAGFINLFKKK